MSKFDITKINEEIDRRKNEQKSISTSLGENTGIDVAEAKDSFLNELQMAVSSGRQTNSTNLIKMVDNKVAEKAGEKPKHVISGKPIKNMPPVSENIDRDELMFKELQSKSQSLGQALGNYGVHPTQQQQSKTNLNEGYLIENVKKVVNNYMNENFSTIFEETMKNAIIEMYAVERIQKVLDENKDLIKKVVISAIRELKRESKNAQ